MRQRLYVMATLLTLTVAFQASTASGSYEFNAYAPLYGQENDYYCGPASAQMILAQGGVIKTQDEIWAEIQINNPTDDGSWYTHPDGFSLTLDVFDEMDFWEVAHGTNQDSIIETIMERMALFDRPASLLVGEGAHWIVCDGFTSDIDPLSGDAILNTAVVLDPWPEVSEPWPEPNPGQERVLDAEGVAAGFPPNIWGSKYYNQYVAIVPVPEPGILMFLSLGSLMLLRRRK